MTENNLTELLELAASRVQVGPAPVTAMVAQARRMRRRRTVAFGAAIGAAVVAVAGTASAFWPVGESSTPPSLAASPEADLAPPGMRLVGLGHAAVAVPETWSTNVTRCGVPEEHTVVIDVGVEQACRAPHPANVDSIEVAQGEPRFDFTADETVQINDVQAQRQTTACRPDGFNERVSVCAGAIYIPSMDVSFRAESSTSATEVDRILDRVQIIPDRVGVPGYRVINSDLLDQGKAGQMYIEALRDAGLVPQVRTERASGIDPGYVLDATPGPGTMLQPGDVVTVTVAAEP